MVADGAARAPRPSSGAVCGQENCRTADEGGWSDTPERSSQTSSGACDGESERPDSARRRRVLLQSTTPSSAARARWRNASGQTRELHNGRPALARPSRQRLRPAREQQQQQRPVRLRLSPTRTNSPRTIQRLRNLAQRGMEDSQKRNCRKCVWEGTSSSPNCWLIDPLAPTAPEQHQSCYKDWDGPQCTTQAARQAIVGPRSRRARRASR